MTLRGRKDLMPIALVKAEEWKAIKNYCEEQDMLQGGRYECPDHASVIVWDQATKANSEKEMHGTFYCEFSQANIGWINVYWQTGSFLNSNNKRPWQTDDVEYDWNGNWNPFMGREHFMELFRTALGRNYAESHTENRG